MYSLLNKLMLSGAHSGDFVVVNRMIKLGADLSAQDECGNTLIMILAFNNNAYEAIKLVKKYPELLLQTGVSNKTAAIVFAEHNNINAIKAFIKINPAILDHIDINGNTVTTILIPRRSNTKLIPAFAKKNPSIIEQADAKGVKPIIWLARHCCSRGVMVLARLNKKSLYHADGGGSTAAIIFACKNYVKAVLKLVKLEPKVLTQVDGYGRSITTWLARYNNYREIRKLAKVNPSVLEQTDEGGRSAVFWLSYLNNDGCAKAILALAKINPLILKQEMVVTAAIIRSNLPLLRSLLDNSFMEPPDLEMLLIRYKLDIP